MASQGADPYDALRGTAMSNPLLTLSRPVSAELRDAACFAARRIDSLKARLATPWPAKKAVSAIGAAILIAYAGAARCEWIEAGDQLRVTFGPKVIHFNPSPEHAAHNNLVSAELLTKRWTFWGADRSMIGFAVFDNSFGQFSQYLSFGQEWDVWKLWGGQVYANVSAGLIHGYKDPYANKIPFNQLGVAPGILPTLGWRRGHFSVSATLLGFNGLLLGAAWSFDLR